MLKALRQHARYFYVLFFIVILTFIFWGVGTVDKTGVDIVAEVGKYKITAEDYWRTYDSINRFYREIYKDKFNEEMEKQMNLKENVLNSMINERVLLIAAKEAGVSVSDIELQESIAREPAFMRNGVFDMEVYVNRLKLNRTTPEIFESAKRQELTADKMKRLIELSVDVPDVDPLLLQSQGDEQTARMISQAMLSDLREKAVKSYIEGLKRNIKIKINEDLIA